MAENEPVGGAKPALAAHSKDASAKGPTPASAATAKASAPSENDGGWSEMAHEGVEQVKAAVGNAAETLSEQGRRAADQTVAFVYDQTVIATVITGVACFTLGVLLGRR